MKRPKTIDQLRKLEVANCDLKFPKLVYDPSGRRSSLVSCRLNRPSFFVTRHSKDKLENLISQIAISSMVSQSVIASYRPKVAQASKPVFVGHWSSEVGCRMSINCKAESLARNSVGQRPTSQRPPQSSPVRAFAICVSPLQGSKIYSPLRRALPYANATRPFRAGNPQLQGTTL